MCAHGTLQTLTVLGYRCRLPRLSVENLLVSVGVCESDLVFLQKNQTVLREPSRRFPVKAVVQAVPGPSDVIHFRLVIVLCVDRHDLDLALGHRHAVFHG